MTRRGPLLWLADHIRPWQIGFLIGLGLPAALGASWGGYWMWASTPPAPGEGGCATGMVGPLMLIFLVAPICGTIGAVIAAASPAFWRAQDEKSPRMPAE
jgi:hypothetical protein